MRSCERPAVLVGWCLGGFLARAVARDRPELVRRVITMGSPVIGGARHTAVAPLFALRSDLDAIAAEVEHLEVETSHAGLGVSPDVLALVTERLAAPASAPTPSPIDPVRAGATPAGGCEDRRTVPHGRGTCHPPAVETRARGPGARWRWGPMHEIQR